MYVKVTTIALIAFVETSAGQIWDGFVASWDYDKSTHFYTLPQTYDAAVNEGWTNISGVDQLAGIKALGYYDDPTFVLLFDQYNNACGFQYAFPAPDPANSGQLPSYDQLSEISIKTLNGVLHCVAMVYFKKDEANSIRQIWVQEDGTFVEIPTIASQVPVKTKYKQTYCIPSMGCHYFALTSTADCPTVSPFFFLANEGYIVGVGFQTWGQASTTGPRIWWEDIFPTIGLLSLLPNIPICTTDWMYKYGVTSLHVWFVADPQNIPCNLLG